MLWLRSIVSPDDHILYVLVELGLEYESMISVICAYTDSPSIQDITSLLLTKESRIECTFSVESSLPSANLAAQGLENNIDQPIKQQNTYKSNTNNRRGRGWG